MRDGCDCCGDPRPEALEWVAETPHDWQMCFACLRKIRRCALAVTVNLRCKDCAGTGCHRCHHGRLNVTFAGPEKEHPDWFEDRWLKDSLEREEGHWPTFARRRS